jgi:hypothetical protein
MYIHYGVLRNRAEENTYRRSYCLTFNGRTIFVRHAQRIVKPARPLAEYASTVWDPYTQILLSSIWKLI